MLRLASVVAVVTVGCATPIDTSSGGPDAGVVEPTPGERAVARAQEWVDAQLPYCQAANHQRDYDAACAMTCTRPDNPEWDPYRSDCSGLVSWAWGLPAPGHTTATLAPFDTSVSHAITGADLQPGDAINNDHHTMLFASWITEGSEARFLEEPGCSSSQPYAREYRGKVTLMGQTVIVVNRGTYTAIRHE